MAASSPLRVSLLVLTLGLAARGPVAAAPALEALDRGVVAIHQPDGRVFVGWRLLGDEPAGTVFNLYRKTEFVPGRAPAGFGGPGGGRGGAPGAPVKLNDAPLTGPTFFVDASANLAAKVSYFVRAVVDGRELEPGRPFQLAAGTPPLPYLALPLQPPEGTQPNDASAADLDGDGDYDLVVKFEQRPRDNSQGGPTGETKLQGYALDFTGAGPVTQLLWTINLGRNIREGAHYTQFLVYDFDGDGRAELVCKTADGTVDGTGKVIGDPAANWVQPEGATAKVMLPDRRTGVVAERTLNLGGHVLSGPEYLTVFDGRTGAALATTAYVPGRLDGNVALDPRALAERWGDGTGNRSDRYLAAVAYLDGERPSFVMCRGYYTRTVLAAWDWRDGKLAPRWVFDSETSDENRKYRGQGNHNLSVADVDGDGRDEIVYGAAVIDDTGRGLYSTGWGHGDAMHVSDLLPANPGLEVFNIQERFAGEGMNLRDAATGRPLFLLPSTQAATTGGDAGEGPGRGAAFNIDPRHPGSELWAAGAGMNGLYSASGQRISERRPRAVNFAAWWDGDLLRELLDRNVVTKWNWENGTETPLLVAQDATSNNGTKATPTLSADLLGDWREEIIWRSTDGKELRLYTTTIPTPHRLPTLMHDRQYRLAVAWQNVAYNQPPHPSFALDEGAPLPARPPVATVVAKPAP
ncbi:MAG: hypothetical protein B9S34_06755 [Opitutia bacterium Tous-C1TDCM]|nr:MAG: hypothetical protein B9S34_06755 [Opitutae bacterium Tous-C1TDCM]